MNNDRLRAALKNVHRKLAQEEWHFGFLGRHNADDTYSFEVRGRRNFVYVTLRLSSGAQTVTPARNDASVPFSANLPVRMRMENGLYVVESIARREDLATVPPGNGSGVPPHTHDDRYYRENEHINVSVGAPDAGKPIVLDAGGKLDASLIDSEDVADVVGTMVTGNTETGIAVTYDDSDNTLDFAVDTEFIADTVGAMVTGNTETDIAVTYQDADNTLDFVVSATLVGDRIHAATGKTTPVDADELGLADSAASFVLKKLTWANLKATIKTYYDSVAATLTNKTLDSTNIASLTAKNPPVDADSAVIVDSAAANVFKSVTYTNIKAFLKTYFDTLYVALTGAQTIAGAKKFTDVPEVEMVSATLTIDATTGSPRILLQEAGVTKWRLFYDVTANAFSINDGSTNWFQLDDTTGVARFLATTVFNQIVKASSSSGLKLEDDGANAYIHLKDGGEIEIRRDSTGILLNLAAESITESGTLFQTGFRRESDGSVRFAMVLNSATSAMMGAGVNGDTVRRLVIQADGKFLLGDGTSARDTNLYRSSADHLKTDDDLIVAGDLSAGVDAALGKFHVHDGTTGWMKVSKTAVVAVSQTIIPDGTGDVTKYVAGSVILDNAGAIQNFFSIANGANMDVAVGGSTWRFAVSAAGAFTVIRTVGTGSATISLDIMWQ